MIRILIADDNKLLCQLLAERLKAEGDFEVVSIVDTMRAMQEYLQESDIELILLDYSLQFGGGSDGITRIRQEYPEIKILVFSVYNDADTATSALIAGASAFITKNSDFTLFVQAIKDVCAGVARDYYGVLPHKEHKLGKLSAREKEVLVLIASGYSNRMIAEELFITLKTVEAHRAKIKDKTGINNTSGLIKFAIREGLISSEI